MFRCDAEALAVDLGICIHTLLSIGFIRGLGNLASDVNLSSLSSVPADRSSNAATNHHYNRETAKAMKTNFHHVGCSWSLSTNTLGPRDRFGNRGATNYTLNVFIKVIAGVDLNASYIFIRILIVFDVDHDRLRQAVHHTASELNGWDIDPFLPVHSEVTSQISNKGVTGVSTDVSNPYQKPPVTAPTFSQRPRPAKRFAPSRHRECNQLGHTQGKSTCLPLCSPRLHWSSSTAESVQMRFRACPSKSRVHLAIHPAIQVVSV